jgi:predicted nucleotidyltransferase component of viral defense system
MTTNIMIHKNLLITILKDFFTHQKIAPYLGFKGGTAVLLFYNLPRFSVDLDFDLLNQADETMIFEEVRSILTHYGQVKAQKKRYSLFFLVSYTDKSEGAQNIKIEINKRNFGSKYEVKQYLGISMLVMVKEDIVAHKLVAMHERIGKTNRDIFDVWFFFKNNWPINTTIVELRTDMSYQSFLQLCIHNLEKMSNRAILSGIGELLDNKQNAWVKTHLLPETIFLLKLAHSNHPVLKEDETTMEKK